MTTLVILSAVTPAAQGQQTSTYENSFFRLNYPSFLAYSEDPAGNGVLLRPMSEVNAAIPSFQFTAYVYPVNPTYTLPQAVEDMKTSLSAIPGVQIKSIETRGDTAFVDYSRGDGLASYRATHIADGKMYVDGFDYMISPNDIQHVDLGVSIMNTMVKKSSSIDSRDLEGAQQVLDNWGQQLQEEGERMREEQKQFDEDANIPGTDAYCYTHSAC